MKLLKTLLLLFVILFLIAAIATFILNAILPKKIESAISSAIKTSLHKNVKIKDVIFNLNGSITLKDITIYQHNKNNPYLTAENISILPFYPSLLSKKTFIISSIKAKRLYINITRNKEGKLNLPYTKQENNYSSRKIFIKNIYISGGTLKVTDEIAGFYKTFHNIAISLKLSFGPEIIFRLETNNREKEIARIEGKFNFIENKLNASVFLSEIQLADYKPYFKKIARINSAVIEKGNLAVQGKDIYSIGGNINLKDINISKQSIIFKGKAHIIPDCSFDIKTRKLSYNASGSVSDGKLQDIPYLDNLDNLSLSFDLHKDTFTFSSLKTDWRNNSIEAKGSISDFKNPFINLNIKYKGSLGDIERMLQKAKLTSLNTPLDANSIINANIRGNLKKNDYSYNGSFSLKNMYIQALKDINKIQCEGAFDGKNINIKNLSLLYKNIPLTADIIIEGFNPALVKANIKSSLFNTEIETFYKNKTFTIDKMLLKSSNSHLKAKGYINTESRTINASLSGYISIDNLENILKKLNIIPQNIMNNMSLRGNINVSGAVNGKLEDKQWQAKLSGKSDVIQLKKQSREIKLKNIEFTLYAHKNEFILFPFTADIWKGITKIECKFDSSNNRYIFDILAKEIDLALARKSLALKNRKLSGKLSLKAKGENPHPKDINYINATGAVMIEDGNIWEMNFLKGLGEFLFIPDFENIIFSKGFAEFTIKNKTISISNLELDSPQMQMAGEGDITFAGKLNLLFYPDFNPNLISASAGLRKIFTDAVGKTGLTIEVKGTVQKPRYKFKSILLSPINSIKDLFKGLLQIK